MFLKVICCKFAVCGKGFKRRKRDYLQSSAATLETLQENENLLNLYKEINYLLPAAEYCRKLKAERSQMQNEADILKQEISSLNQSIRCVN